MDNLVIVESHSKIKTIQKILGKDFIIIASGGHIDNLPKKELGIDIENNFKVKYVPIKEKKKKILDIIEKTTKAKTIWIATDKDYEGERIAESIKNICKLKNFNRVYFTEITTNAIKDAFSKPEKILNQKYLDCQETRRIIDRLVGYKLTPILWKNFENSFQSKLSIGRVQAATLSIVIDKENEIKNFASNKKWKMKANFESLDYDFILYENEEIKHFIEKNEILKFFENLNNKFTLFCKEIKRKKIYPPKPFITSTLQQTAYQELGFPIQKTMKIAQELYEKGLITYLRTDSHILSSEFIEKSRDFLISKYGKNCVYSYEKVINNKKNAQEAHEAIRPTSTNRIINLSDECKKLYEFIWIRTMSFLLNPYEYDEMDISIQDSNFKSNVYFKGSIKTTIFLGFKILSENFNVVNLNFEKFKEKYNNNLINCNFIEAYEFQSEPPKYFDEASLVKMMENKGIGRPATYQSSIEKLISKNYIIKTNIKGIETQFNSLIWKNNILKEKSNKNIIGKQNNKFIITDLGKKINEFLNTYFKMISEIEFTKTIEENIDEIISNNKNKITILNNFYDIFSPLLTQNIQKISNSINETCKTFTIGKKEFKIKNGNFGYFINFNENNKKKNICLQPFLNLKNITIDEFSINDLKILIQFPCKIKINNIDLLIEYGRYGIYCKDYKLNKNEILKIINLLSN